MANAQKGEVGLEVGGQRYTLKPTFNALCDLEELTGKTFVAVAEAASRGSAVAIRQLVWAYLQEYHGDEIKAVKDAGNWIGRAGGIGVVQEALDRLLQLNTESSGDRPQKAQATNGTGESSTSAPGASA